MDIHVLRIGPHDSSSFCLISATKFKLLFSPLLENLVLNFPQFCRAGQHVNAQNMEEGRILKKCGTCENQLYPREVHLPIVRQISLRERRRGEEGRERRERRKGRGRGREEKWREKERDEL